LVAVLLSRESSLRVQRIIGKRKRDECFGMARVKRGGERFVFFLFYSSGVASTAASACTSPAPVASSFHSYVYQPLHTANRNTSQPNNNHGNKKHHKRTQEKGETRAC